MVARQPIDRKLRDRNLLDVTKSAFETKTSSHSLGEMVQEIAGVKAGKDSGFQVYLALEKGGKLMQVGLPCVSDKEGQKHFLDATNMKAGDIDAMLGHLPEDVELMVVWRLDHGMTQDIVVTENSIMAPMADAVDYSALDRKPCIGCGGGIEKNLDLVLDIMQVEIFGGEKDDPIRMSAMMAAPPVSHGWDHIPTEPQPIRHPEPERLRVDTPRPDSPKLEQTDFSIRMSWTDSIEIAEAPQPAATDPLVEDSPEPVEKEKPQLIMLIVYSEKHEDPEPAPACRCEPPAGFRPSEKRLYRQIYSAPPTKASQAPPQIIPQNQPLPETRPSAPPAARPSHNKLKAPPSTHRSNFQKKEALKDPKPLTEKTRVKVAPIPKARKAKPGAKKQIRRRKARQKKSRPKAKPKTKPRPETAKKAMAKRKPAPEAISEKPKTRKCKSGKRIKAKKTPRKSGLKNAKRKAGRKAVLDRRRAAKRKPRPKKRCRKKSHYLKELIGHPSSKKKSTGRASARSSG